MSLKQSAWLVLMFLVPVLLIFSRRAFLRTSRWRRWFSGRETRPLPWRLSSGLAAAALAALSVALAGPETVRTVPAFDRGAVDILIGIDISLSMLAEDAAGLPQGAELPTVRDLSPSRLAMARRIALDITGRLSGERAGLFVFAEAAVEVIPLTRDYGFCRYVLENLNDTGIAVPGSNLGRAVIAARGMMATEGPGRARVLVLISDGEDVGFDAVALAEALGEEASGMTAFAVGAGGPDPVLIPMRGTPAGGAPTAYYHGDDGGYLKTRRIEAPLRQIATLTGGAYFRGDDVNLLENLMADVLIRTRAVEGTSRPAEERRSLSAVFLAAALASFAGSVASACRE